MHYLSDDAEEALTTIAATIGCDADDALNSTVISFATILQAQEGQAGSIYRVSVGGKRELVKRMLLISELYESERFLHGVQILILCGLAMLAVGALFVAAAIDHDWWAVAEATLAAVCIGLIAADRIITLAARRR